MCVLFKDRDGKPYLKKKYDIKFRSTLINRLSEILYKINMNFKIVPLPNKTNISM